MAVTQLSRLTSVRPLLALFAYPAVMGAPFLVSWGLLEALGAVRGERLPVGILLLAAFAVRHVNVFVMSTLHHRCFSHGAFRYHPALEFALRLWSWLFMGLGVVTFALLHRHHHANTDTADDPHSPSKPGESWWTIAQQSNRSYLYIRKHPEEFARYAQGLPQDRFEAFVLAEEKWGFGFYRIRGLIYFGAGISACSVLLDLGWAYGAAAFVACLPALVVGLFSVSVFAINGLCHVIGYRSYAIDDTSANLFPIELLAWGEALHQNHHVSPSSANFAHRAWEWDPAYSVLWLLSCVGLVRDLKAPKLTIAKQAPGDRT